ncbi:uncharacterized protein [Fopius arisanus]|uniref:Serine/threonine-protein kinase 40 n=2 Tax=Fopius arisanus TaxID=64838 RepID=A0A9R1T0X9_9HYME|nr:PREDICTED: uncharacterized protein LOC105265114 [Fopius arisanus]XP_011300733.1 PREDICTED: uncharacterized protein LOC105265114 [Fopius arisanus]
MPARIQNDGDRTRNSDAPSEPSYETMDTSDEPSIQVETDHLPEPQPIESDILNLAIDVPYTETDTTALPTTISSGSLMETRTNSLDSTNTLSFNSISGDSLEPQSSRGNIGGPRNIYDLSDDSYDSRDNVYIPRAVGYERPILHGNESSDNTSEVQEVPELVSNRAGPSRITPQSVQSSEGVNPGTQVPSYGPPVSPNIIRRAGPYILGPLIGTCPVKTIIQCLARKEGTDKYYTIKMLTLKNGNEHESQDDRQGKMLLHAEYSLLSLLHNQDGVVHHHGLFKDSVLEEKSTSSGRFYTGRIKKRLCLVLDCLTSHDFNPRNDELLNLQHHMIREKRLPEKESLLIFTDTVRIVAEFHKKNIVHRDLKLGNIVLNRKTKKVTITNFCLGTFLASEKDLLKDQRGSPAYVSPDVLCGKPYLGKPSDMWSLGVVLFTMLYGYFPFYDTSPTPLYNKIRAANYHIPNDGRVSEGTTNLIRDLLVLQPNRRLTAVQVLESLRVIIETFKVHGTISEEEQVVPDTSDIKEDSCEKKTEISERKKLETRPFADLLKKMTVQEQMQQMINQQSPLTPRTRPFGQIPVYRVDSDPRELTQAELDKYSHLIPRDNQRNHPHGSRREGVISRNRSTSRFRTTSETTPPPVGHGQSNGARTNPIHGSSNPPAPEAAPQAIPQAIIHTTPHALGSNPVNLSGRETPAVGTWPNSNSRDGASTSSPVIISRVTDCGVQRVNSLLNSGSHDPRPSGAAPSQNRTVSGNPVLPVNVDVSPSPPFLPESPARAPARQAPEGSEASDSAPFREMSAEMSRNARISELRSRYDYARMSMAIRACILNRNNQRPSEHPRPLILSNRSVPDVDTLDQERRSRAAVLDRIVSLRIRMQQNRIDNIERQTNVLTSLNSSMGRVEGNRVARGRATLSQHRHTPYSTSSTNIQIGYIANPGMFTQIGTMDWPRNGADAERAEAGRTLRRLMARLRSSQGLFRMTLGRNRTRDNDPRTDQNGTEEREN